MNDRTRLILFVTLVVAAAAIIAAGLTNFLLYRTAFAQQQARLVDTVKMQARRLQLDPDLPGGLSAATLSRTIDALERYEGFGRTGEFTFARRDGERILFLLGQRRLDQHTPPPIPFDSPLAEPMRRALRGETGTIVGLDYRGETVLAAYEPVSELDLGVVAKIDLAEIRAPFVLSGLVAAASTLAVLLSGAMLSLRFGSRLLKRREESEARTRAILASTLDPVVTIDAHGTIRSVSDSVRRVFGWAPGELVGNNVNVLMPEPHHSRHDGYLAGYRRTGHTNILGRTREFDAVRKDGTVFPVEISVSRVEVPGNAETLFTGIMHDVTDRKRSEEELRLLQSLALAIGEAGDVEEAMTVTLDRICEATDWDYGEAWVPDEEAAVLRDTPVWHARDPHLDTFQAMSQGTRFAKGRGLPGRVWAAKMPEWLSDLADDPVFARADTASRSGLRAAVGVPILSGDRVVAVLAFFMKEPGAEDHHLLDLVSAAVAPLGPVIERKQAEAALAESERRLREMLQGVELVAITLDGNGQIIFCNDYLLRLTGWSRSEVQGRNWFQLFVPADRTDTVGAVFAEALAEGRVRPQMENEILTRQGERRLISWNNTVLRDPGGDVIGTTSLGVDITDQRRAEEELGRHQQHLEELIDERTAELEATHDQLRLADRLASMGTLAAGLGHDMNNVLLPIRCRLDALQASDAPRETRDHYEAMRRSVEYLQHLTDGLHLLSLDPEDSEASQEATDLPRWWQQVGPLLRTAAPSHSTFTCDLAGDLPPVSVAPHRLTQAVLNLVVNAAEAIPEGGHIRLWAEAFEDRRFVRLGVTDDGRGMSMNVRRRALDPFFTTKRRGLGTGLGLALVHGVAKSAGGSVRIESQPGKGTTVMLILAAARQPQPHPVSGPDGRATAVVSIGDRRMATIISTFLDAAGMRVHYDEYDELDDAALWVTEASESSLDRVRRYLSAPGRQVVALGGVGPDWTELGAIIVAEPSDFEQVRLKIGEAVSRMAGPIP